MTGPEPGALHRYIEGLRADRDAWRSRCLAVMEERNSALLDCKAARAECAAEHAECERLLSTCPSGICLRSERS